MEIRPGRRHIDSAIFDNILRCSSLSNPITDLLYKSEVSSCGALVEQDQYPEAPSSTLPGLLIWIKALSCGIRPS